MTAVANAPKRGDKVDLYVGKGTKYRTVIDDITDDGLMVMAVPSHKGIPMSARRGDELSMCFYRNNGKFVCEVKVRNILIEGLVRLLLIELTDEPVKEQNRESYRLPIKLKVILYQFPNGKVPHNLSPETMMAETHATTKNLSTSGALIQAKTVFNPNESILIALYMYGESQPPVMLAAKAARQLRDAADNTYELGFQFFGDSDKQDMLMKYVLEEQQKQVQLQRSQQEDEQRG